MSQGKSLTLYLFFFCTVPEKATAGAGTFLPSVCSESSNIFSVARKKRVCPVRADGPAECTEWPLHCDSLRGMA